MRSQLKLPQTSSRWLPELNLGVWGGEHCRSARWKFKLLNLVIGRILLGRLASTVSGVTIWGRFSCLGIHTGLPSSREPDAKRLKIFPMAKCRNYSA